jgi:hypothetical protein
VTLSRTKDHADSDPPKIIPGEIAVTDASAATIPAREQALPKRLLEDPASRTARYFLKDGRVS